MTRFLPLIGLTTCLLQPTTAAAEELPLPTTATSTTALEPVLVVGRRSAGADAVAPATRTVWQLGPDTLKAQQPDSVPQAVEQLPGVWGQATNRGAGSPLLRGLVGPQNLIVIDGLRLNTAVFRTGPNQYLGTIDPSAVERIEVLPGPAGVLYGSDAMGGVLALYVPRLRLDSSGLSGSVSHAVQTADDGQHLAGSVRWAGKRAGLLLGGAWRRHGNLRLGGGDVAPLSDFTQWGWHARAALALTARWRLQATVLANGLPNAGRTDELGRGTVRNYANRDVFAWVEALFAGKGLLREARVAALVHQQHEVGDAVRCTLSAGQVANLAACAQAAGQVARGDQVDLPASVTRHDRTQDEVWVVGALATSRFALVPGRIDAVVGVEATQEAVDSRAQQRTGAKPAWKSLARGNFSDGSRYAQTAAYAHVQATPWTGKRWRWLGTAGGRGGWVAASAPSVPGVGDVQFTLPVAAASIGTTLELDRRHSVFVHASNGLRAPNLQETTLLGNTADQFEVPNAGLNAESIQQLEVGVRSQTRWLSGQVVGYVSQLDDFIDRRKLSTADVQKLGLTAVDLNCTEFGDARCVPVYQRQNVGRGSIQGAELALSGPTWQGARPWLTASLLRGATISGGKEEPLRRAPPAQLAAGIQWQSPSKRWSVAPWWRGASAQSRLAAGDRSDLRICEDPAAPGRTLPGQTCTGTPGWQTWNLRLGGQWPIARGLVSALRLDLDLTNLADSRYRVHGSGLDAPGRGVRMVLGAAW